MENINKYPVICSDFTDTRYYIPNFNQGSIAFFKDEDGLHPIAIVSHIAYNDNPEEYEHYLQLPQEKRNDYMKADLSCEFLIPYANVILGFKYITEDDFLVTYYC